MADSATVAALSYRLAVTPEDKQSVPEYLVVYWSIESGLLSSPANRFSVKVRVSFTIQTGLCGLKIMGGGRGGSPPSIISL